MCMLIDYRLTALPWQHTHSHVFSLLYKMKVGLSSHKYASVPTNNFCTC
jgi:hypothetical protein